MIQSMTGFGKASAQFETKKISIEIKSLNSKGLDLNVRTPSIYREKELFLRNWLSHELERGKIDFSMFIEVTGEETSSKINAPIVKAYIAQMKEILPEADATELMKMAVRMPDALKTEREEIDETEWQQILPVIEQAIKNIKKFRTDEGLMLQKEFENRILNIKTQLEKAILLDSERIENIREKLKNAISELNVTIDENRFEQELIFYLEKLDVTEERVRLTNHLNYFLETINQNDANGRKLGFIGQEMGREINTLGSKANHAQMQKHVVLMKDELEKIKEQVLNIL